ncbi:Maltose O-acetyltransferase [Phytophthora nicotianae]|nr:Maltose O-acetyltransferase [Phytophthora nicotianae]
MDQLKEQSKKASDKLEDFAKKTQQELEKTSKKAQESIEKATKQTKDSINRATKQSKEASESGLFDSAKEAFHIDIKEDKKDKKKTKPRRKDSSDSDTDEEDGLLDDIGDEFDQLTLNQRALGAIGCYMLSGLFAFAATVMLFTGVHHVRFYALFYSLSNIATFCSLIFIMGQERLKKRMLSRKRSVTGRAWMGSLALTVVVAFFWPSHWFIVLLLLLVQFGSMIWYSLSYIPFGRKFLHKYMAKRVILVDAMDGKIDGK